HTGYLQALAFSQDGTRLVTGSLDTTAVVWDVAKLTETLPRPEQSPVNLTERQLDDCWTQLGSTEARMLWPAMDRLVATPSATVALLREKLKPEPAPDPTQVARWIADLGNPRFKSRDKATRALAALGSRVGPALAAAIQTESNAEARHRIEQLLQVLRDGISVTQLQPLRAIEVLERIRTPEAKRVREVFITKSSEDDLNREPEFAPKRMRK